MTVGLPGTGIGGMFYMLSALAMPIVEAYRRVRGHPAGSWRVVAGQLALTAGILSAMTATGWLLVRGLAAVRRVVPSFVLRSDGLAAGSVLRTAMLVVTLGTLAGVLLTVELLRLWVHRRGRRDAPVEQDDASESGALAARRVVAGRRRFVSVLVLVIVTAVGAPTAVAQSQSRVVNDLARAEAAYRSGDAIVAARAYATVLAADPTNSRATYRLAQLRRKAPHEALRLFRRYVALEPSDVWGYIAVADVLEELGRHDESLRWYEIAIRLAPAERDAVVGRAHVLSNAGRIDAARAAYNTWLAIHPGDAAAWRELARLDTRAGRPDDAARALGRVHSLAPDPMIIKLLAVARGAAAPAFTPLASGRWDTEGNSTSRFGGAADLAVSGPTRVGLRVTRARTLDGTTAAALEDVALLVSARPQAVWRLEGFAGATRIEPNGGKGGTVLGTGQMRARWRAPGGRTAVDLRIHRSLLDATSLLLANRVVRTELGGVLEAPVAKSVTLRGIGRFALLSDSAENNHRTTVGGVVAFAVAPSVEVSGQFHQTGYAHSSAAGYFAPRLAQVVEVGSYFEIETPGAAVFACDLGMGIQRVALQDAPPGAWRGAFRLYALISLPLAPGRELRLEFDGENSASANEAATSAQWRSVTAALSLRWAVL